MNQNRKYKIGITSCFMYPDLSRSVFGAKSLNYLENDMAGYVSKKGVIPVLIPDLTDELLYDLLDEMDGFVFQGGADLAPQTYGEQPLDITKWPGDIYRDRYELKIMDYAIKKDKTILGICRGMQLMNVYFGGTLYQDLQTQRPDTIPHRDANLYDTIYHKVRFKETTVLDHIYANEKDAHVNTVHHQAIKDIGKNLEVWATCPEDNIIEAIGYKKGAPGKVMGVQWHPEFSSTLKTKVIDADKLYNHFLSHLKKN